MSLSQRRCTLRTNKQSGKYIVNFLQCQNTQFKFMFSLYILYVHACVFVQTLHPDQNPVQVHVHFVHFIRTCMYICADSPPRSEPSSSSCSVCTVCAYMIVYLCRLSTQIRTKFKFMFSLHSLCVHACVFVQILHPNDNPIEVHVRFVEFVRTYVCICADSPPRSQSSCLGLDLPLPILLRIKFKPKNIK
jgi:hypothetical protein